MSALLHLLALVLLTAVIGFPVVYAAAYPVDKPVPGGIAVVKLELPEEKELSARFGRKRILTLNRDGTWWGVVGIDLNTPLGNYLITADTSAGELVSREFSVTPHAYPYKPHTPERGLPPQIPLPQAWKPKLQASFPFSKPAQAQSIDLFGTRYTSSEGVHSIHCAILRLEQDTSITAPGAGTIQDVVEFESNQFFIIIEHGMGLYSAVGPVLRVRKEAGQTVKQGEVIGEFEIGTSPSGALNWKMSLNGVAVDPLLFVEHPDSEAPED